jgi:hypothetical protein
MYELRVVALSEDARYVVLAPALEGRRERYRLPVDDRLRAALRGELGRLERRSRPDSALTPREMQARLRAGETAETIAEAAGVPVEWVLRFEAPVLAERGLVAQQARRSSLSVSGGEWTGVPLEEVVTARLEADGVRPDRVEWDAWRRDDGRWVVAVRADGVAAQWLWDPALQRLVVHDDAARLLLHPEQRAPEAPDAQVIVLAKPAPAPQAGPDEQEAEPAGDDGVLAEDPQRATERADPAAEAEPGEGAAEPTRGKRSRRKSVPSWEDILLGTGTGPGGSSG